MAGDTHIRVEDLTVAYGDFLVQKNLNFEIGRGEVFIIMGGSGCGKSSILKLLQGLKSPATGGAGSGSATVSASLMTRAYRMDEVGYANSTSRQRRRTKQCKT